MHITQSQEGRGAKMKKKMLLFGSAFLLLAACSAQEETKPAASETADETLAPIEVSFETSPKEAQPNEPVTIQVEVTQNEKPVDDADEVQFEIWQGDQDNSEMIDAKNKGDGVYAIEKEFDEPGVYSVMYHVTARDMHKMTEMKVNVGGVGESREAPTEDGGHGDEEDGHGHSHH